MSEIKIGSAESSRDEAFQKVLDWVRDVDSADHMLSPIEGIGSTELPVLSRLGALISRRLPSTAPRELVARLDAVRLIEIEADALAAFDALAREDAVVNLAELYARIVAPENRRPLGTFFTPRLYAQAIVDGFVERNGDPSVVVDVGAGVGIFSDIARSAWPEARIYAIDVNPLTLGLQAVATAQSSAFDAHLVLADYQQWLESFSPEGPTLYLGNPPYTRWQLLGTESRSSLLKAASGLVSARANLSTIFLAMTLAKLRAKDSLAMIIPSGWMRADYGRSLREHLRDLSGRQISIRMADSWRFHDAIVDAVLVEVGPEEGTLQPIVVTDWSGTTRLPVSREQSSDLFPAPGRLAPAVQPIAEGKRMLLDVGRVTRGFASGANDFFIQGAAEWDALGIPSRFRRPLARRLRAGKDHSNPMLEVAEVLVLQGYQSGSVSAVDSWIRLGETLGTSKRYLCSKRARWYDLSAEVKEPDVILSSMGRKDFYVLENTDGLAIANNHFGIFWTLQSSVKQRQDALQWLRSESGQEALRLSASVEANGLYRLSPRAVGSLAIGS